MMIRILGLKSVTTINSNLEDVPEDLEQYWIVGFVSYFLSDRESSTLSYDLWDQIKLLSTESRSPIEQQFFKSSKWSSYNRNNPDSRAWQLIDPPILALKLLVSGVPAVSSPTPRGRSDITEGLLSLLFRLHFVRDWDRVEQGYNMAYSLGRASVPIDDKRTRSGRRNNHSAIGYDGLRISRPQTAVPTAPGYSRQDISPAPVAHARIMSSSSTDTQSTTVKCGLNGMKRMIDKLRQRDDSDTNNLRSAEPTPSEESSSTFLSWRSI